MPLSIHPIRPRVLPCRLMALALLLAAVPVWAAGKPDGAAAAVAACRAETDGGARLRCYDTIPLTAATGSTQWGGRNNTDSFEVTTGGGAQLLIEHGDAILVGSLKDANGTLLQNLHLAGPGRLAVALVEPGTYTVTISATGAWSARLEEGP